MPSPTAPGQARPPLSRAAPTAPTSGGGSTASPAGNAKLRFEGELLQWLARRVHHHHHPIFLTPTTTSMSMPADRCLGTPRDHRIPDALRRHGAVLQLHHRRRRCGLDRGHQHMEWIGDGPVAALRQLRPLHRPDREQVSRSSARARAATARPQRHPDRARLKSIPSACSSMRDPARPCGFATDSAGLARRGPDQLERRDWIVVYQSYSFRQHRKDDHDRIVDGQRQRHLFGRRSSAASPAGNAKSSLRANFFNGWPGGPTSTISNIPYAKYDVYVYAGIDATGWRRDEFP